MTRTERTLTTRELDRLILRVLAGLDTDSYEAERLLRMGATRGFMVVGEAAGRLGCHRNRLADRLTREGLPPAHTLICWGRLISALAVWRPRGLKRKAPYSLEQVARDRGWCNRTHVTKALVREAGISCFAWYKAGASLDGLVDSMLAQWRSERDERRAA